jgi:hypothetical protein
MGVEKVSVKVFRQGRSFKKINNSTIEQGVSNETARIDGRSVYCAKGFTITFVKTGRADEFAF